MTTSWLSLSEVGARCSPLVARALAESEDLGQEALDGLVLVAGGANDLVQRFVITFGWHGRCPFYCRICVLLDYWITGLLARGFVTVRNVQTTTRGH